MSYPKTIASAIAAKIVGPNADWEFVSSYPGHQDAVYPVTRRDIRRMAQNSEFWRDKYTKVDGVLEGERAQLNNLNASVTHLNSRVTEEMQEVRNLKDKCNRQSREITSLKANDLAFSFARTIDEQKQELTRLRGKMEGLQAEKASLIKSRDTQVELKVGAQDRAQKYARICDDRAAEIRTLKATAALCVSSEHHRDTIYDLQDWLDAQDQPKGTNTNALCRVKTMVAGLRANQAVSEGGYHRASVNRSHSWLDSMNIPRVGEVLERVKVYGQGLIDAHAAETKQLRYLVDLNVEANTKNGATIKDQAATIRDLRKRLEREAGRYKTPVQNWQLPDRGENAVCMNNCAYEKSVVKSHAWLDEQSVENGGDVLVRFQRYMVTQQGPCCCDIADDLVKMTTLAGKWESYAKYRAANHEFYRQCIVAMQGGKTYHVAFQVYIKAYMDAIVGLRSYPPKAVSGPCSGIV